MPFREGETDQPKYYVMGARYGVVNSDRNLQVPTMKNADERNVSMKKHRQIRHVMTPAQTTPVRGLRAELPADSPIWATRGILVTALMLGCLGAGAALLPTHADTHPPAGNTSLTVSTNPVPRQIIGPAWMY
jgi:hypothetical protein